MKRVCLVFAMLFLLTSCSVAPLTTGENELLKAPMLSQMQKDVFDALQKTLDTSKILYTYPQSGEHRSPFVFHDLDGDGVEEAIVFYAYRDTPEMITVKVLKQKNGEWTHFFDLAGSGPQVAFVEFAPLIARETECMVIGWATSNPRQNKVMSVYSMNQTGLVKELQEPYQGYYLADSDQDGISELLLAQMEQDKFHLSLFYAGTEGLSRRYQVPLYEETTNVLQLLLGNLPDGRKAVYVDEEMAIPSVSYGTEVFAIERGRLQVVAGSFNGTRPPEGNSSWQAYQQTFRKREILSQDINADHVIEVPGVKDSADEDSNTTDHINWVDYMNFDGTMFQVIQTAALNVEAGYILYLPERWVGNVTIVKDLQRQEWRVIKLNETEHGAQTVLFRIRVYYVGDYFDEFTKDDILLATRGLFSYYGNIPELEGEPLAITPEETEKMFHLI